MQDTLRNLIADAMPEAAALDAGDAAHVLLAAIHIDLVEELLAGGRTPEQIGRSQAALAQAVIDPRAALGLPPAPARGGPRRDAPR